MLETMLEGWRAERWGEVGEGGRGPPGGGDSLCKVMVLKRTGCRVATNSWVWLEKGCMCARARVHARAVGPRGGSKSHCDNWGLWVSIKSGWCVGRRGRVAGQSSSECGFWSLAAWIQIPAL